MPTDTFLNWSPPWSPSILLGVFGAIGLLALLIRVMARAPLTGNRLSFLILRGIAIISLGIILLGPTLIRRQQGVLQRSDIFYLVDGSRSMDLDDDGTRWAKSIQFLKDSDRLAGEQANGNVQAYQFGHRISPLQYRGSDLVESPKATDTRLADALRQISARFGVSPPAGVVVLSDGRVRAAEATEQMAHRLGEIGVPVHVVPVGQAGSGGDVAVVSAVVPQHVRKYSDFEVQVFIRSFGMSERRTVVRVVDADALTNKAIAGGEAVHTMASVPLTLSGGAQAVSLPIRLEDRGKSIRVVVDPLDDEISKNNNQVDTRIEIDRTQIRVLYIEGTSQLRLASPTNSIQELLNSATGTAVVRQTAVSRVERSLDEDEDIDCMAFRTTGQAGQFSRVSTDFTRDNLTGFPPSRSQLYALDCVILSNVGPSTLTDEQATRLVEWIGGRGGGLLVVGPNALNPDDWKYSPLRAVLPCILTESVSTTSNIRMQGSMDSHAVLKLTRDAGTNASLFEQMPSFDSALTGVRAAPLAETIAVLRDEKQSPCFIGGRYGRGRVLVSTVALVGGDGDALFDNWGEVNGRNAGKLWRNLVYWGTESSSIGRRRLVAIADKRFYRPGDTIRMAASAYDESAQQTSEYRVWCMLEPSNPNDPSLYSPMMWPDGQPRTSGETGPRIAWGEEFMLTRSSDTKGYELPLVLSETDGGGDSSMRAELTAFDGQVGETSLDHGTQIDSVSLELQILSDPFEMRNPLPNHDLLSRLASISGGKVLKQPNELAEVLKARASSRLAPTETRQPAWNRWWLLTGMLCLISVDWIWRRAVGMA